MNKILSFLLTLFWCFIISADASSQVFSGAGKSTDIKAQTAPTSKTMETSKSQPKNNINSEENDDFGKVEKNFSGHKDNQKKYDNSERSVYRFKIVKDKIVFEDDNTKRDILIYYDNFELHQGLDGITRCSFRLYVMNDLKTKISSIGFKLIWPDISTTVQMNQLNPGVKTYSDMTLLGDGCLGLDKTPTIEINRCRVKGLSEDECADAVHWYPLYTHN